jgi:hypothetical protein
MNLLHSLAEYDRELKASPQVERQLVAAFRRRKIHRRVAWSAGVAAVIAAMTPLLWMPRMAPLPQIHVASPSPPALEARQPTLVRVPSRAMARPPREVVTEFFPLMDPAPPMERGELLRVEVPASAMRLVGLPVREENLADRIQADVLVGEEGMARAIRFVRFDSK